MWDLDLAFCLENSFFFVNVCCYLQSLELRNCVYVYKYHSQYMHQYLNNQLSMNRYFLFGCCFFNFLNVIAGLFSLMYFLHQLLIEFNSIVNLAKWENFGT